MQIFSFKLYSYYLITSLHVVIFLWITTIQNKMRSFEPQHLWATWIPMSNLNSLADV